METERNFDPDGVFWEGWFSIHPDDMWIGGYLINSILIWLKSRKRARVVIFEDAIRATGIWTPEQAMTVVQRMVVGANGNFCDPKERKGLLRFLQYLGVIN